jgi:site-specific DNA recombinase
MRAAVYVRISDDRTGAGLGVARQEADCRALCEKEGWQVAEVFVDNDVSAYSGKARPAYARMLDRLTGREFDVLVAWHPDRLHRSPKELEAFIDLLESTKTRVRTVMAGEYDLATPTGRMTARVVGAVARHESEHKADRTRRKHRELAEAGKDAGGGRPFGFREDRLTVDPVERALVADAAQAILDGRTLRSVVVSWNAAGVATATGGRWSSVGLKRLLTSPRTGGYREHAGKLHKAVWEPLLDEVTWRRVRAVLLDPGRRKSWTSREYLLTGGIARCGREGCGAALIARPRADKRRCYVCASPPNFSGCGKIRVLADPIEDHVLREVKAAIDAGRMSPAAQPGDLAATLAAIDEAEAALAELADDYYAHRAITKAQFQSASAALSERVASLRAEVSVSERERVTPVVDRSVLDLWPSEVSAQQAIIRRVVDAVYVDPAVRGRNFYDPERVRIDWR